MFEFKLPQKVKNLNLSIFLPLPNNRSIIETVTRYPSGLTEAVILAELELLW